MNKGATVGLLTPTKYQLRVRKLMVITNPFIRLDHWSSVGLLIKYAQTADIITSLTTGLSPGKLSSTPRTMLFNFFYTRLLCFSTFFKTSDPTPTQTIKSNSTQLQRNKSNDNFMAVPGLEPRNSDV